MGVMLPILSGGSCSCNCSNPCFISVPFSYSIMAPEGDPAWANIYYNDIYFPPCGNYVASNFYCSIENVPEWSHAEFDFYIGLIVEGVSQTTIYEAYNNIANIDFFGPFSFTLSTQRTFKLQIDARNLGVYALQGSGYVNFNISSGSP